jgi:hypothetical protein
LVHLAVPLPPRGDGLASLWTSGTFRVTRFGPFARLVLALGVEVAGARVDHTWAAPGGGAFEEGCGFAARDHGLSQPHVETNTEMPPSLAWGMLLSGWVLNQANDVTG